MATDETGRETRILDAREIDGEPFGEIVSALEELSGEETLVLVNDFEPEPLYAVLERRGYDHDTAQGDEGEYRVSITEA